MIRPTSLWRICNLKTVILPDGISDKHHLIGKLNELTNDELEKFLHRFVDDSLGGRRCCFCRPELQPFSFCSS